MNAPEPAAASPRKAYLLVSAGSFCISFTALFVREAAMDPTMVAFYRMFFGGIALLTFALARRDRIVPSLAMLRVFGPAGIFLALDLGFWHGSIVRLGPGLASIIGNFQVFFLALHGALFLGERLSLRYKIAVPLALLGLFLLVELNPTDLPPHIATGIVLGLVAAVFYTCYILRLRTSLMLQEHLSPVANMALISFITATSVGLYCGARGISFAIPDMETGLTLAALGVLCQAVGWVLLSFGLPLLPPSRAGLIMLTQPTFAFIWDILFCGRVTGVVGYIGAATAIFAIWLGVSGSSKKGKTAPVKAGRA